MTPALTLADLIRQHQDKTGDSYSVIARRAGISKAKVGQLAAPGQQPHMPRIDTIEKVATGLNLPLRVVQQAALASAGITPENYDSESRIDLLVALLRDLPPADLENAELFIHALHQRRQHG